MGQVIYAEELFQWMHGVKRWGSPLGGVVIEFPLSREAMLRNRRGQSEPTPPRADLLASAPSIDLVGQNTWPK